MKRTIISALVLLLLPVMVLAANEAVVSGSRITIGGHTVDIMGTADQVAVDATSATFSLSANSTITVRSYDRLDLNNNLGLDVLCGNSYSEITVSGIGSGSSLVVTLGGTCSGTSGGGTVVSSGGGGGGVATTAAKPITATGQVTATVSEGGKTTLTVDGNIATVDLPVGAVVASTAIKIQEAVKDSIISSRPVPTSRKVVGSYIYEYTATAGGETVSAFSKQVVLTFTYTDSQISGLNESTLKVYYWKENSSQWVALPTTIDATSNTLTADTNHFTYFALLGLPEGVTGGEEMEESELTVATESVEELADGDLIRNSNAEGAAQFDIYIAKIVGSKKFKRLILSPHVFESYAHFDKNGNGSPWDDVQDVNQTTMNAYTTSDLVRADGDTKVYQLTADGDSGTKKWLNMTAEDFIARGYDSDSIYTINAIDRNAYATGEDID